MFVDANGGLNLIGTDNANVISASYDTRGTPSTLDDLVHVRASDAGVFTSASFGGVNHLVMHGLGGDDRLENGTPLKSFQYGGKGNDVMIGGSNTDYLYGEFENDKLFGKDGNDYLDGGDGMDELHGGNGSDYIDTGNDAVFGEIAFGEGDVDTFKNRPGDFRDWVPGETIIP